MLTRWTAESEKERLIALQVAEILDSNSSKEFDRLTIFASNIFNAPIAIITIVDEHRQWFKSAVGVDIEGTPRGDAFCDHTIRNEGIMVIADTHDDSRFVDNPLVKDSPFIRFYAGVPLVLQSGHALGSLCIIDSVPRNFTHAQCQLLIEVAEIVQSQIRSFLRFGRHDEVTGLPNRSQLRADLDSLCILDSHGSRGLVLIEVLSHSSLLDISSALGLSCIEKLLRDISDVVLEMTGTRSTVYHVGLARFAWIINAGKEEDEENLIDQLLNQLRRPIKSDGFNFELQPRAGIVRFELSQGEVEDVIRKAMVSVQQASYNERSFHRYEKHEDSRQQRAYRILQDFGAALEGRQLRLVYQPKFNTKNLCCEGVEALVRWNHHDMGEIPPGEFIPLIEATPLIHGLTRFVLQSSLEQVAFWRNEGIDLRVAINVSPRNLEEPNFAAMVQEMCALYRVPVACLIIECTEGDILTGAGTVHALEGIRAIGVKVALDDFGAAYSNLASLKSLPAEILKIDRSMICDVHINYRALTVLKAIITMANGLDYRLVAEGVESAEVFDLLVSLGVDEIQGYYFSLPLEASNVRRFVEEKNQHLKCNDAPA